MDVEGLVGPPQADVGGLVRRAAVLVAQVRHGNGRDLLGRRSLLEMRRHVRYAAGGGKLPCRFPLPEERPLRADLAQGAFRLGSPARGLDGRFGGLDAPPCEREEFGRDEVLRD